METEKKEVGGDITSVDVAPIPAGRQRSRYLAVGTADSTVGYLFQYMHCMTPVLVF